MSTAYNAKLAGDELQQLVDSTERYIKQYGQLKKDPNYQSAALIIADKIVHCINHYPQPTLALAMAKLDKTGEDYSAVQLSLSTAIFCAWYFRNKQYHNTTLLLYTSIALSSGLSLVSQPKQTSPDKALYESFKVLKFHGGTSAFWRPIQLLTAAPILSHVHYAKLGTYRAPEQALLVNIVFTMCWHTYRTDKPRSYAAIIRSLWYKFNQRKSILGKFIDSLPTPMPGVVSVLPEGRALVLGADENDKIIVHKLFQAPVKIEHIDREDYQPFSIPFRIKSASTIAKLWSPDQEALNIVKPLVEYNHNNDIDEIVPLSALRTILNGAEADMKIDDMAATIAYSAPLSSALKAIASQQSRQNLGIKEIKHAILLLGLNRTPKLLTLLALQQKLIETKTPMQNENQRIFQLINTATSVVADQAGVHLSEDIGFFLSIYIAPKLLDINQASLFYQPRQQVQSKPGIQIDIVLARSADTQLQETWNQLAENWSAPVILIDAFHALDVLPQQMNQSNRITTMACEIALVLLLIKHVREGGLVHSFDRQYQEQACEFLSIKPRFWNKMVSTLVEESAPFAPI